MKLRPFPQTPARAGKLNCTAPGAALATRSANPCAWSTGARRTAVTAVLRKRWRVGVMLASESRIDDRRELLVDFRILLLKEDAHRVHLDVRIRRELEDLEQLVGRRFFLPIAELTNDRIAHRARISRVVKLGEVVRAEVHARDPVQRARTEIRRLVGVLRDVEQEREVVVRVGASQRGNDRLLDPLAL